MLCSIDSAYHNRIILLGWEIPIHLQIQLNIREYLKFDYNINAKHCSNDEDLKFKKVNMGISCSLPGFNQYIQNAALEGFLLIWIKYVRKYIKSIGLDPLTRIKNSIVPICIVLKSAAKFHL